MWAVEATEHSTDVWTVSLEEQNQPNLTNHLICIMYTYDNIILSVKLSLGPRPSRDSRTNEGLVSNVRFLGCAESDHWI